MAPGTTSLVRTFIWIGLVSVQAEMVPASESKMNLAGIGPMLVRSLNPFESLNTWPVGAPIGTVNTSGAMLNGAPSVPPAYKRGHAGAVIGHPQRRGRPRRQPPRVDQVGIGQLRPSRDVADQVGLAVAVVHGRRAGAAAAGQRRHRGGGKRDHRHQPSSSG